MRAPGSGCVQPFRLASLPQALVLVNRASTFQASLPSEACFFVATAPETDPAKARKPAAICNEPSIEIFKLPRRDAQLLA